MNGIKQKKARATAIDKFTACLDKQEGLIKEFDMDLWSSLVDYATVYDRENIVFTFVNGVEIKALQNHGRTGRWEFDPAGLFYIHFSDNMLRYFTNILLCEGCFMIVHMTKDTPEDLENELTDADAKEMLGLFEEYFPEDYSLVKYEFQKLHPERFGDAEDDEMIDLDDEIMELVWRKKFEEKQIP